MANLPTGRQAAAVTAKKIKFKQMKRAYQILIHEGMINGEQQLLQLKNKI